MARDQHAAPDAVRITTASSSRNEDISLRQKRYVISMSIRTLCFVSAVLVGPGWVRWVLVAGAVLLPYVAVVLANATSSRSDGFALQDTDYGLPMLGEGPTVRPDSGAAASALTDPPTRDGSV